MESTHAVCEQPPCGHDDFHFVVIQFRALLARKERRPSQALRVMLERTDRGRSGIDIDIRVVQQKCGLPIFWQIRWISQRVIGEIAVHHLISV